MKFIKVCFLSVMIISSMAIFSYGAPKDYATLSYVTSLQNKESPEYYGTVRITITGVVGTKTSSGLLDLAKVPDAYYYAGDFLGPNISLSYREDGGKELTVGGYATGEWDSWETTTVPNLTKAAEKIIDLAESGNCWKVDVKLIPVVEGATMKIELVDSPYLAYYQFHYPALTGTQPLLLTEVVRRKSFIMEMWTGDAAQTGTFKKIVDDDGTFRAYEFPVDHPDYTRGPIYVGEQEGAKAFYVVTEAEAKAMLGKTAPVPANTVTAIPTSSKVVVDGANVSFEAYNINGNNYFKLRDLAKVLSGSEKQFEVGWDSIANAIQLTSNKGYTTVGGELALSGNTQNRSGAATTSKLYVDGQIVNLTAYNIGNNNYFKLRDIGKTFNFGVEWNEQLQTIAIITANGYTE